MIGFLVGMQAEAKLLAGLRGRALIAVAGADAAVRIAGLIRDGATALVSLGLAAGLDPKARPGDLLVPSIIVVDGQSARCDLSLCARLGGDGIRAGSLLHSDVVVAEAGAKQALFARTGCVALDMESGVVARAALAAGLPFAALRAICDPVERSLPPLALRALAPDGGFAWPSMLASLLTKPQQIADLLGLARDATAARRTLLRHIPVIQV
ncbi:hypothetical protein [Lichenicoccus sp.]|uniref:phosphorylase family protein n=1 Tax=Lichenicoccus sp. TaxID=2781899 RepID=UPI003D0AF522